MEPSSSPKGQLNKTDYFKATRGAVLTLGAVIIVKLIEDVLHVLRTCKTDIASCPVDFAGYDFVISFGIAALGLLLELMRRRVTNYAS